MAKLPNYQPKTLSLGPLETEIVEILWQLGPTSATAIHQQILGDIDRELTYSSVSTVLKRLIVKGWVACDRNAPPQKDRRHRAHIWRALISQQQAEILTAHEQLHRFLAVGSPEIVAAFADSLDDDSLAQIDAIAQKIQTARQARTEIGKEDGTETTPIAPVSPTQEYTAS
ncbi:MAG: BlaI/MecI/CopY family transcriptional regulator [Cyanobacteria bacterium P01_A01_bin.116]